MTKAKGLILMGGVSARPTNCDVNSVRGPGPISNGHHPDLHPASPGHFCHTVLQVLCLLQLFCLKRTMVTTVEGELLHVDDIVLQRIRKTGNIFNIWCRFLLPFSNKYICIICNVMFNCCSAMYHTFVLPPLASNTYDYTVLLQSCQMFHTLCARFSNENVLKCSGTFGCHLQGKQQANNKTGVVTPGHQHSSVLFILLLQHGNYSTCGRLLNKRQGESHLTTRSAMVADTLGDTSTRTFVGGAPSSNKDTVRRLNQLQTAACLLAPILISM